jgi:riboflavin kinase/FMN adenylyltransferase
VHDIFVKKLNIIHIISGYDHKFGYQGKGNFMLLEEMSRSYNFETEEIPAHDIEISAVSSTRIREALNSGKVKFASKLLGYQYFFRGKVVKGLQIGTSLGFPTANIQPENAQKIIPAMGVYSVRVKTAAGNFNGMMNIGIRPTLDRNEPGIEVHLFDCNENLYGQSIEVSFVDFIRKENKFKSLEALRNRLIIDSNIAKKQLLANEN